jgi:crossover junction endodeoxyribonuclease RuvC
MILLAIDPGISGCLALLDEDNHHIDHLFMPSTKIGKRNRVNGAAITRFLEQYKIDHCFIEAVHSMPGQGVSTTFSFGHSAGMVEGIVTGAHIPFTLITPQAWKKWAGLSGQDKDAARARAVQMFPDIMDLDYKGKGQALADALLIGVFGNLQRTGKI